MIWNSCWSRKKCTFNVFRKKSCMIIILIFNIKLGMMDTICKNSFFKMN